MDAAGVLRLATALERDRVAVIGRSYAMGSRITRYALADGRFVDGHDSTTDRFLDRYRYSVYLPGGDPSGCAAFSFAAQTLTEAAALAGLARVVGRCDNCRNPRPLALRDNEWQADPNVPCPAYGCGADIAVTLLCRVCRNAVRSTDDRDHVYGFAFTAWVHRHTGVSACSGIPVGTDADSRRDRVAQLG